MMKQFDVLKQKKWNQAFQGEAAARLKNIMDEVKNMKRQVDDKLRQILGSTVTLISSIYSVHCTIKLLLPQLHSQLYVLCSQIWSRGSCSSSTENSRNQLKSLLCWK